VSGPTLLADLVDTSHGVGEHAARRTKVARLAEFLRRLAPGEIDIGVSYLAGVTRQGRSGIGYALVRDARSAASADAAGLTLTAVDATLGEIARASGRGSLAQRAALLSALFAGATAREQEFLVRLLLGELRQGALEGLMIEAVAAAAGIPAATVRRASMIAGGIASVASSALTDGAAGLGRFAIVLFQPVAPMLAQPADDITDAMARIPLAAVEWKLDGARVQVHKLGDEVRIYTRTGNEVTAAAPEIVSATRLARAHTLILDGEAIVLKPNAASGACSTSKRCARRCHYRSSSSTASVSTIRTSFRCPRPTASRP
jgi:DNA ligase-1